MKKLFSLMLSLCLMLCLCAVPIQAAGVPAGPDQMCSETEWELLKLTNRQRIDAGLPPCSTFSALQEASHVRASELIKLFSHSRPDGSKCFSALTQAGANYNFAGENIAAGQSSPSRAVTGWMNSEGHRENIMNDRFVHVGVGHTPNRVEETYTNGWVQMFLSQSCNFTRISLSSTTVNCPAGDSLESLDLYITAICSAHGICYVPVLEGMYTGFDPHAGGTQLVTVSYGGHTASLCVHRSTAALDTSGADSWAVDWLNRANTLGLLSKINRTGFTSNVSRLQFADLAVSLAETLTGRTITPAPENSFSDTTEPVILKAKAAGIAGGYQNGNSFSFRPNNSISRQEICVMLANVVNYVNASAALDRSQTINGAFIDKGDVADWAVKQVALMTNNGIMGGKATPTGNALDPQSNTALQEAITLSVKLYDILK